MTYKTITCSNAIETEALKALLADNGIACVSYDETNSKVARGILDATVQVIIREEDYATAIAAYNDMLQNRPHPLPWCPKCGSDNVERTGDTTTPEPKCKLTSFLGRLLSAAKDEYLCRDCGHRFRRQATP